MIYLPIITALVSGFLVWALGRWSVRKEERKQENKKLNRLLYNILELKHWVDKEINAEAFTKMYSAKMVEAMKTHVPELPEEVLAEMTNVTTSGIKQLILKQPQLLRLEQNIAEIVRDYSEIDPFFAYDLTGKYQLTEYMENMKSFIGNIVPENIDLSEATTFANQLLRPAMLEDLQKDLVIHLPQIARMIGAKTAQKVLKDHLSSKTEIDEEALNDYCQKMLPQLVSSAKAMSDQKF
jgi:hypothetical protein